LAAQACAQTDDVLQQVPASLRLAIVRSDKLRYVGERRVEFTEDGIRKIEVQFVRRAGRKSRTEIGPGSPKKGEIIVEDGFNRYHFFPSKNEIHILPPHRDDMSRRLLMFSRRVLRKGGRFAVDAGGQIAGVDSQLVSFVDSSGNTMQRLWIDEHTGLVLRREVLDKVGAPVGSFEFVKLDYSPIFHAGDFMILRRGAKKVRPEDLARELAQKVGIAPLFVSADSGFRLESSRIMKDTDPPIFVQFYTAADGAFSLFQVRQALNDELMKRLARGEYNVFSWQRSGETIVLVGDLPLERLRTIGKKLQGP
jgi:hypothetical protein